MPTPKQLANLKPYPKGVSGNPKGKPKGTISVISRIKKQFRDDPEGFEKFIEEYKNNKQNHKHLVEMIDGKPKQTIEGKVDSEITINIVSYGD